MLKKHVDINYLNFPTKVHRSTPDSSHKPLKKENPYDFPMLYSPFSCPLWRCPSRSNTCVLATLGIFWVDDVTLI